MYNNTVERIVDIANSNKPMRYNILTFPTHERYETQLCKTGHEFYSFTSDRFKRWNTSQVEVPSNYHILPDNQVCGYLKYDFILVQSKFWQFQVAQQINQQLSIPIICLEHTLPTPQTMTFDQINSMRQMSGDVNIFISDFSKKAWNINGAVIHHGVDTNVFCKQNIDKKLEILTVANDFINRDYCLNYSGWKRVTNGLDVNIIGDTKGLSSPAKSIDELVNAYNTCSIYFNSSTLSPIPMSLLEAMSCGCPVVSTATCMIPEIIKNGENGFISNNEEELRSYIDYLLNNPEEREKLGNNARQTVIDKFSEYEFIQKWNELFDKVYEETTK
jgi:hypothetical protein